MSNVEKSAAPLTGKKVLLMVCGFFAIIIASNAFMITKAITSFRGEDTKKSYLQGLHYNDTLDERAAQAAAGWTADLKYTDEQISMQIRDGSNHAVAALVLRSKLRHPTDTSEDIVLEFMEQADGIYIAKLEQPIIGKRTLLVKADTVEGFEFSSNNELWLQ